MPAAAALATEERKAGSVRISSCQEAGIAVSMTVNMELGIAAIKAAAVAEPDASLLELTKVAISAVAVTSGAGALSAVAARIRGARALYCMVKV